MVADTCWWETVVLHNSEGRAALFALSQIAGIDPRQGRSQWESAAMRRAVRTHRPLLFAHLRRMRHRGVDPRASTVVYQVLAWMLLVTECPFSSHHRNELIENIRHDPACRHLSHLHRLPARSDERVRAEALSLLLTDLRNADTSCYVSDPRSGLRVWWSRRFGSRDQKSLLPFLRTEIS